MVVVGVLVYGYYSSYVAPARAVAAYVGNATITMGDVVKRMRALQAMGAYSDPRSAASAPQETLISLVESEMAYQAALKKGVTATDLEVSYAIQSYFYPTPEEGEEVDPAALEREYEENYGAFLNASGLSDGEFRHMTRRSIVADKISSQLAEAIPNQANHVEVYWILILFGENYQGARQMLEEGEDFATVCQQYNTDASYADENCYVGWVPEGAFPDLDETLFSIEHDTVSAPVSTTDGTYFIKVVGGPEVRDISETMRHKLELEAYGSWVDDLWDEYRANNAIRLIYNSERDAWAREQLKISEPTPTPTIEV